MMTDKKVEAQPEVTGEWVMVPRQPTSEMINAANFGYEAGEVIGPVSMYTAMLSAAPSAPSAIEGYAQELAKRLVREKLSAAILEEAKEWTGDSRGVVFLALSDLAKRLGVNISKNDLWAAQADHALIQQD